MSEIDVKTANEALEGVREVMKSVKGVAEKLDILEKDKLEKMEQAVDAFEDSTKKSFDELEATKARLSEVEAKQIELEKAKFELEAKNSKTSMSEAELKAMQYLALEGKMAGTREEVKGTLRSDQDVNGGFLTPTAFSSMMIKKSREISPIRQKARTMSMDSKSLEIPADGTYTVVYGAGEMEAVAESNPTVGTIMVTPDRVSAKVRMTRDLIMNAALDINGWVMDDIAKSYAVWEGQKFLSGTGVKEPQGILTDDRLTTLDSATTLELSFDDVLALPGELKEKYQGGEFMFTRKTRQRLRREVSASDNHFLWTIGGENSPSRIDGYAYSIIPDMATPAADGKYTQNSIPVLFGDLSQAYTIFDRQGLTMIRDEVTLGGSNAIIVYFHRYLTGLLTLPEAVVGTKIK